MSISILLQYNSSSNNTINKTLTTLGTITGTIKEDTSLINPTILIEADLSSYPTLNYCTISAFNRSYYINNIKSCANNLIEITCHVDVLESYSSEILSNGAIVNRQQSAWNMYINDGSIKCYQNPKIQVKEFPNGFTTQQFVLAVAGS